MLAISCTNLPYYHLSDNVVITLFSVPYYDKERATFPRLLGPVLHTFFLKKKKFQRGKTMTISYIIRTVSYIGNWTRKGMRRNHHSIAI